MFREINIASIFVRFALALVIGGMLGMERGRKNRPAGFRTYMLVCIGAAMVMMTNQYVFQLYNVSDPVRMGAQVVSGIGFLGAGTIITTNKNHIKGITTAAGLWAAACSGLAIGAGFYEGAVIGGLAVYFVMAVMQKVDSMIHNQSKVIDLYVEYGAGGVFSSFLNHARANGLDVFDVQISKNTMGRDAVMCVMLSAKSKTKRTHSEMIELLSKAPGVQYLEEI